MANTNTNTNTNTNSKTSNNVAVPQLVDLQPDQYTKKYTTHERAVKAAERIMKGASDLKYIVFNDANTGRFLPVFFGAAASLAKAKHKRFLVAQ